MKVSLIIAAGGRGKRFREESKGKSSLPKLFLDLAGRPLLAHTLEAFRKIPQIREIVLALPPGTQEWAKRRLWDKGRQGPPIRFVRGGRRRAESVWNALRRTSPKNDWVMVHDGARPFPPRKAIVELLRRGTARRAPLDGIILARPVVPTLKRVAPKNGRVLETVDRSSLYEAETPQLVRRSLLFEAYRRNPKAFLATDESSLIESVGGRVKVLPHSGWNLKVTTPADLALAEAYFCSAPLTVGFGRDTHRLVKGRKLYLGGVRIPFEKGALGHSDGDVLLHAIADGLLGAVGLGDLGEWFPPTNPRFKGIRSEKMLKPILAKIQKEGWWPARVDSVIILERPPLLRFKNRLQKEVARILGVEPGRVSIKAKTAEGLGPEGEGLAVTCEALVLLKRGLAPFEAERGR